MATEKKIILSVIISVKVTDERCDILDKLSYCFLDCNLPDSVEIILSDDGSSPKYLESIKNNCIKLGMRYASTGADSKDIFNLARTRNVGVQHAKGSLVTFLDIDLVPYPGFYQDLLNECTLLELSRHVSRFLMVPVIYLTDYGRDIFLSTEPYLRRQKLLNAVLSNDRSLIEQYSSGTSVIVVNRYHFLMIGGQDERFKGWGYEDYEFATRLILHAQNMPIPPNWLSMAGNFMTISSFEGWKAIYRIYGDWLASKGIFLFHMPHHINYKKKTRFENKNYKLLTSCMKAAFHNGSCPASMVFDRSFKSLLFRDNPFCNHAVLHPFLGERIFCDEYFFIDESHFASFLEEKSIGLVVFPNPYASQKLTTFYSFCRKNNINFIVAERGALPDSIFHDRTGFLNEGTSYKGEKWDKPLSPCQQEEINAYINTTLSSEHSLELQHSPKRSDDIRKSFGLSTQQKILLVPMQLEHDTVVRYFSGDVKSFDNFCETIKHIANSLGSDWSVFVKTHPADNKAIQIEGCLNVDNRHINDLIVQCDAVAVINSGVGILSMMANKPLYVFGTAFYAHDRLCCQIKQGDDASSLIRKGYSPDRDAVYRFIYYLRFKFYSFGSFKTIKNLNEENKPITSTIGIQYHELRTWTSDDLILTEDNKIIDFDSPLFDRYRNKPLNAINVDALQKVVKRKTIFHSRKLLKLKKDPHKFFRDLRFSPLRILRFLFFS